MNVGTTQQRITALS